MTIKRVTITRSNDIMDTQATVDTSALRATLAMQVKTLMPDFDGDVGELRKEDIVAAWERSLADGTTAQPEHDPVTPEPIGPVRVGQTPAADLPTELLMAYLTQQVLGAPAGYMTRVLFDELSKRLDRARRREQEDA